jgi:hypothetical protein
LNKKKYLAILHDKMYVHLIHINFIELDNIRMIKDLKYIELPFEKMYFILHSLFGDRLQGISSTLLDLAGADSDCAERAVSDDFPNFVELSYVVHTSRVRLF